MAGSSLPMETGDRISALGGAGALRLWRATIHLLSAGIVGAGSGTEHCFSVGGGFRYLHLAGAGGGGRLYVSVGAAMARPARRNFRSRTVCGESLSSGDCVLAECIRRIAGGVPAASAAVAVVAGRRRAPAGDDIAGAVAGGFLAGERSSGGDDPLFDGVAGFGHCMAEKIGTHSADECGPRLFWVERWPRFICFPRSTNRGG